MHGCAAVTEDNFSHVPVLYRTVTDSLGCREGKGKGD